jgi:hypothetical protein
VIAIIAVILVFFVFMSLFWVSQRDTSTAFTRRASESLTIEPDPIESAD